MIMIIDRSLSSSVPSARSVATAVLHHKRPCISPVGADMVAGRSVTVREATVRCGRAEQRRARVRSTISVEIRYTAPREILSRLFLSGSYRSFSTLHSRESVSMTEWLLCGKATYRGTLVTCMYGFCHVYLYD